MPTGQQTLAEIETAITNLHRQEQSLQADLEAANAERIRLFEQRTAAFRELAEVRTRSALADGVIDAADRLHHRVEALLRARQRTVDDLKERRDAAMRRRGNLIAEATAVATEIAATEAKLDAAAEEARARLAGNPDYEAARVRRDDARAVFAKAQAKTERAEADRIAKGKAYESDPLFMYLWRRKYRADTYRPMALIRWADDQVARLIGYNEARANYAVLLQIPERLRAHTQAREAELKDAQRAVDVIEADEIRKVAGVDLVAAIDAARTRQKTHREALEAVEVELTEIATQLNRYAQGTDDAFRQAVALSAGFLEQESYQRLVAMARETVEPTDDEIVARISNIERRVSEIDSGKDEKRRALAQLANRRQELMQVAADFRRAHYDDPGSVFGSDDIAGALLEALIRGTLSRDGYWDRLRRDQSWQGRPADPFRRGSGWPPFGGGWMGGSWSGGSWGGGGSRSRSGGGGGDFSTGGGF